MTLSQKILTVALLRGLNQRQVGESTHMGASEISKIRAGKREFLLPQIALLSARFYMTAGELCVTAEKVGGDKVPESLRAARVG